MSFHCPAGRALHAALIADPIHSLIPRGSA